MKVGPNMSADENDAHLIAFVDGRLDESARASVEARLATDASLRARVALLRKGDRPFASAFDALLDEAPLERLNAFVAALDPQVAARSIVSPLRAMRADRFVAAIAVLLFCVGIVVGRFGPTWPHSSAQTRAIGEGPRENWRQSVAEYMSLYSVDTFASAAIARPDELAKLGAKLGLPLTPENVGLANLQFRSATIFSFDGAPLGQLGYLDATTGPLLFCIIRDSEPDAAMKAETREGFSIVSWALGGRGYMLIGRLPTDQMAQLADSLARRL
jgi:anti-sigma factor RsiW